MDPEGLTDNYLATAPEVTQKQRLASTANAFQRKIQTVEGKRINNFGQFKNSLISTDRTNTFFNKTPSAISGQNPLSFGKQIFSEFQTNGETTPIEDRDIDPMKTGSARVDFVYRPPKALSLVGVDPNTGGPKTSKSKIKQTIK